MKKQKLKIFLLFSSLVFLGIFFDSCQMDDNTINEKGETKSLNFKLERVKFNKFSKNSKLIKQLSKIEPNKKQNEFGKTVSSTDGSFTINTEFATYIESDNGKHSYTFKINRENPEFLLENLILNSNDSLGYDSYLVKYQISQEEYNQLLSGINIDISDKATLTRLEDNGLVSDIFNKETIDTYCTTVTIVPANGCPCLGHTIYDIIANPNVCTCNQSYTLYPEQTVISWSPCSIDFGNGGPSGNSSSGGGATGDNDSNYDGSDPNIHGNGGVSTAPTLEEEEIVEDPCESLKNGTNSVAYKQKFKDLTSNYNLPHETGFVEKEVSGINQYVDMVPDAVNAVQPPTGSKNATHVHQNLPKISEDGIAYDGRVKIHSIGDLESLIGPLQRNNSTTPKDAFVLMLSNEAIYAITILEPFTLSPLQEQALVEVKKNYLSESRRIIGRFYSESNRKIALQKMFLKELKILGIENKVGFFEGVVENESDLDINNYNIKWTRKKLKKSSFLGSPFEETPCN